VHLVARRSAHRSHFRQVQPRVAVSPYLGLHRVAPEGDEVLQPSPTDRPVQCLSEWIEPLSQLFNLLARACLECTVRLDFSRHINEPHLEARWDLLAVGGEVGLHGRLAGGDAEDAKALHGPQGDVLGAAELRRPIGQPRLQVE